MSDCAVCKQPLQEGYEYCHFCGAPIEGAEAVSTPADGRSLVEVVDRVREFSTSSREVAGSAQRSLNLLLGSQVSLQRQILYALLAGFALASSNLRSGWVQWLGEWLSTAVLLLFPISYWMTGVFPLSRVFIAVLGPELSLRRRLFLSVFLTLTVGGGGWALRPPESPLAGLIFVAANFLTWFYFMGFAASWRPVSYCGSYVGRERMGTMASTIALRIRESLEKRQIAGLDMTVVSMAKLRHYTAGDSSAKDGEQISFISGKGRVVVFVQNFGNGLFVRWAGFYDASGRRLWLFMGFLVSMLDRLLWRWLGSSYLELSRQAAATLSPANRHQILLRATTGGVIARTLRLAEGVSEYSWNQVYALEQAVHETVVTVLQAAASSQEEADEIRSQIEYHKRLEMSAGVPAPARR